MMHRWIFNVRRLIQKKNYKFLCSPLTMMWFGSATPFICFIRFFVDHNDMIGFIETWRMENASIQWWVKPLKIKDLFLPTSLQCMSIFYLVFYFVFIQFSGTNWFNVHLTCHGVFHTSLICIQTKQQWSWILQTASGTDTQQWLMPYGQEMTKPQMSL